MIDLARDVPSRFTSYPNSDSLPVWSPDGARIVFTSPRGTPPNLYLKTLNGQGGEELLGKSKFNNAPSDWSRDGRFVVYSTLDPNTQWDLWLCQCRRATDRKLFRSFNLHNEPLGQFSPDGCWLASSDESGTNEVHVLTSEKGAPRRIRHRRRRAEVADGREFYYVTADGSLMAMSLKSEATLEFGTPTKLFALRTGPTGFGYNAHYAVSGDGQRFIVSTIVEESPPIPPKIVLNWPAALRR